MSDDFDSALELPRDDDGRVVGFLVGKAQRIADWLHQRDERDFARQVNSLRVVKWQRENPEKHAAKNARYHAKPETKRKNAKRQRAAHAAAYRADPIVCTCDECGSTWCKVPWARGKVPRFCSTRCYQRGRVREREGREPGARRPNRAPGRRKPSPPRRPYRCGACGEHGHNRLGCPHGKPRGVVPRG